MVKTNLVMYVFFIIASDVVDCCRVTVFDILALKRAKLRHLMYLLIETIIKHLTTIDSSRTSFTL